MEVHEPSPSAGKPPRVIRPPRYVFNENSNVTEIVTSITNGLPVESVNPCLYGNLYPYLQVKSRNLVRDRNYVALRYVEDAMNSIQDYFVQMEAEMIKQEEKYREETRQLSPEEYQVRFAAKEEARKNALHFTDEEMEESVQYALNGELDKIDTRIVPLLSAELRKRQRNAIKQENYMDASIYRNTAKSVNSLSNGLRYEELTAAHIEELENRVMNAADDLDQLKRYWKEKIKNAKAQKEADLQALRNEQAKKLAEFDKIQKLQQTQKAKQPQNSNKSQNLKHSKNAKNEKEKNKNKSKSKAHKNTNTNATQNTDNSTQVDVNNDSKERSIPNSNENSKDSDNNNFDDIPPQYCRYTNKVSELKKKEASLVSSKRFLEAIEARKEVEKQIQLEQLGFRRRYKEDMAAKRAEYIKQMQNKMNVREQDAEAEMNLLLREMDRQITQQQKTLRRFELQWQQAEELNISSKSCDATAQNSVSTSRREGGLNDNDDIHDGFNNSRRGTSARSSRDKDRMAEEAFRQRRAINAILYTRPQSARLPKIDKKY